MAKTMVWVRAPVEVDQVPEYLETNTTVKMNVESLKTEWVAVKVTLGRLDLRAMKGAPKRSNASNKGGNDQRELNHYSYLINLTTHTSFTDGRRPNNWVFGLPFSICSMLKSSVLLEISDKRCHLIK
jgi:hypothetical protein